MSRIVGVAPVLPEHRCTQDEITAELAPLIAGAASRRHLLERVHSGAAIATRHLALPLTAYRHLQGFTETNELFIRIGTDLAEQAVRRALDDAGLTAADVDVLFFTSVTGVAAPSLDALLVPRVGLRPDVKRIPSFGLGCVAGAAGLARLHDHLVGHPEDVAVLVSVELCSLTLQSGDESTANFVATGLFGDGAAAAVLVGDRRAARTAMTGPDVLGSRSQIYPGTGDALGWAVGQTGFRILLSPAVPDIVEAHLGPDVAAFLDDFELKVADVVTWLAHPGGPRVLEAAARSLGLPDAALGPSWESLHRVGNLSSSSVLHLLADAPSVPGGYGLVIGLGPGLSAEFVLLRWSED